MNYPLITIGCPVRNRAWILPEYLQALKNIDYPNKRYFFLVNDCTDNTLDIIKDFSRYNNADFLYVKTSSPIPNEKRGEYGKDGYYHMAAIRNKFLNLALHSYCEYILSVDSDIIVPSDILQKLFIQQSFSQFRIMGAAISNIEGKELDGYVPGNFMQRVPGTDTFIHPSHYPTHGLYKVDMVGAISFMPTVIMEFKQSSSLYYPHPQGEDCGFALHLPQWVHSYVNMDCRCKHQMRGE